MPPTHHPDDFNVGGNNGIVELYAPNLNTATRKLGPLHKKICIAPKWAPNPSTQLFEEATSIRTSIPLLSSLCHLLPCGHLIWPIITQELKFVNKDF